MLQRLCTNFEPFLMKSGLLSKVQGAVIVDGTMIAPLKLRIALRKSVFFRNGSKLANNLWSIFCTTYLILNLTIFSKKVHVLLITNACVCGAPVLPLWHVPAHCLPSQERSRVLVAISSPVRQVLVHGPQSLHLPYLLFPGQATRFLHFTVK